jgi:hypothetical protein
VRLAIGLRKAFAAVPTVLQYHLNLALVLLGQSSHENWHFLALVRREGSVLGPAKMSDSLVVRPGVSHGTQLESHAACHF